ncbi:hypothetical protein BH11PLA2_BH11PLA2_06230 [soil metagenome]
MERTVLLCGLGRVGWNILDHLRRAGVQVTVVDIKASVKDPRFEGVRFLEGDCRKQEVLEAAGVMTAAGVIIVTSEDLTNVTTALLVRRLNPGVRVVVRMFNQSLITRLGGAIKNMVALSVSALTAPLLALTAVTGNAVTAITLENDPKQIAEIPVDADSNLAGKSLAEIASAYHLQVVSHQHGSTEPTVWTQHNGAMTLSVGDTLNVCGSPDHIAPLLAAGRAELLGNVRWAGWIRRQLRTLRRTLAAVDTMVKIATAAVVLSITASTLVYHFALDADWADSFYNTVCLVATGSDLHGEHKPGWAKTFLGAMKLLGTGLIAAFTAIFTQYLIRARLGGALEARKIPDGGHVVVCGLGNVGFRCVEELLRLKHPVVAIESVNDNPFAATVRRMGVPVILGDATVPAVLQQARANTAGAVIACTDSELVNLEVSLLVRELNPTQRVVLRLNEQDFAQAVRASANIRHAVSIPTLAAPAFTAALFGDRVQSLLTIGTRIFAVVELVVQANDPCFREMKLQNAMEDFRLLPLALKGKQIVEGMSLNDGDCLTAILEVKDLLQLHKRQAST